MQYAPVKNKTIVFWACVCAIAYLFFTLFSDICFPFICGFIIAYILVPFVTALSRSTSKYLSRSFWSLLFSFSAVMIFIMAAVTLVPKTQNYLVILSKKTPEYYSLLISFINDKFSFIHINESDIFSLKTEIQKFLNKEIYFLAPLIEGLASKGKAITKFFSFFVTMPVSLFYFLKDWDRMRSFVFECIPIQQHRTVVEIASTVRKTVTSFFYGQFHIVFWLFIYYLVALKFVLADNCAGLAITFGLLSFIPFIGCIFSCFLVVFVSIQVMTLTKFYCIIAVYFVGQFIEGYVLYPHFVGKKIGLHPLWLLFSFFAGVELDGITGVLIAIPSAAIIRCLCGYAIHRFKATQTYKKL